MELKNKKIMVVGLARTGLETARFLARKGADVVVSDRRGADELAEGIRGLAGLPVRYRLGGEDPAWIKGLDLVVPSPGVAADNPLLVAAARRGVEVLSEIELASRFIAAPLVAVTGTNGKSTTTTLIGEMLERDGRKVFVGGNIGAPLIGFVEGEWEAGVVEVSSFQLEWVREFRPRVAVLLNVTEDHLDRYPDFDAYRRAKERIFAAQGPGDTAVLNRDDPRVWEMRRRIRAAVVSIGFGEVAEGLFPGPCGIVRRSPCGEEAYSLARVKIHGVHNVENMMGAVAAARALGVGRAAVQQTLESFPGLEHRLEFVCEKNGVRYYNDSKGTNVGAAAKSLASFRGPVILIAGGVDKGGDYGVLAGEIRQKVKRLVLFGAARELIAASLGALTETVLVDSLEQAVRDAAAHACAGDVVLLSPACSSFDMFRNYAERGKAFKDLVHGL
ncbi:MAG TPA: UDP-N-acetylmuramoyl-L-alanine--D-glutamate ligase [candidate division Zixibacteria bacterium]|nr:UDP-N-acetylmuramoyl-L-alanine--D-glutamate ligase [candidate division Zixibacteria bacterium]